tara:strand:- start:5730 stop:6479 length:750 start_codon:yes stop_codon:yes gene_type:complete
VGVLDIGVDEAGRGPVIGPLVVCALAIPYADRGLLESVGADDSKRLTKSSRARIFSSVMEISQKQDWGVGVVVCNASRIDISMSSGTLNDLEVVLFAEALREAVSPSDDYTILLDACDVNAERFGRNVSSELGRDWLGCTILSEHGMDSGDVVVGAASIIAKCIRDAEVQRLSEELGMDLGSGYPSDPKTQMVLADLCNADEPHDCLRWGWSTVKELWGALNKGPPPERGAGERRPAQSTLDDWNQQEW